MRVLFINPPSVPYNMLIKSFGRQPTRLRQTVAMPMGILYLSAVLERDAPECDIRVIDLAKSYREWADSDADAPESFEWMVSSVIDQATLGWLPDMIGISTLFSTADKSSRRVATVCKERWSTPIVMGGMHSTNAVDSLLQEPAIDYVCRGEGELIIARLARACAGAEDPENIQGIVGRKKLSRTESCPLVYDLDQIPFPAWHLIPMSEYVHGGRARSLETIEQDKEATIVTTRGCPFHCTFCASWTVHGREMRYRSVPNVIAELRILRERFGVASVIPEDDLFTVKKPRIIELCETVARELPGTHFQFPNGLSVATLDPDVIRAMVRMGMTVANIAIESGSAEVQRKVIKKNVDLARARRVVEACRAEGIVTRCYFILGFPGETRAQLQETIEFARSLPADWCVFNVAAPLIGTEMYDQLLARGEIDETFNWDDAFFHERSYDSPEVSATELKELAEMANREINFFGNYNLRSGNLHRAADLFRDILRMYPDHVIAKECLSRCA